MQLFSIVSEATDTSEKSRAIVISFLTQQLNQQLVEEYLALYDKFIEEKTRKADGSKKQKRTSVNSVKILLICTQINEELAQKQKIIVLIRLLEFIYANNNPSEQELEFVSTVSETFNISKEPSATLIFFFFLSFRVGSSLVALAFFSVIVLESFLAVCVTSVLSFKSLKSS